LDRICGTFIGIGARLNELANLFESLNDRLFIEAGQRSLARKSKQSYQKAKVYRFEIQANAVTV
jgi:hypothetical protein